MQIQQGNKRYTYAVKTVASHCDNPEYPASGDTFRVVFLDGAWDQEVGTSGVTWLERDSCFQATVKNIRGEWVPEGTVCLATFEMPPAGTVGNGKWLIDVVGRTPPTTTSTSTTPGAGPCSGKCRWTWSATTKRWSIATNGCGTTSTTTTPAGSTTTTPEGGSTTTTCACPTSTTTTQAGGGTTTTGGSTTTTPAPTCQCLYPTFCGLADGDCTTTYCAPQQNREPECGQTSTTTTPSGSTTTSTTPAGCDCAGSTTTTPVPDPACTAGCDWIVLVRPTGELYWARTFTGCVDRCDCLPPSTPPVLCATAHTPCNLPPTTTTQPNPIRPCSGTCTYLWTTTGWLFMTSTCSSTDGRECKCYPPSEPGVACGMTQVGCVARDPIGGSSTTTTPAGGSTTTTNPCVPWCQTSTTGTSTTTTPGSTTTTPASCVSGHCVYRWDTTASAWNLLRSNCPSSCPCVPPVVAGYGACHVEEVPCGGGTTTTATTSTTTSTSTTTTPPPCETKSCQWECRALSDTGAVWGAWYCVEGNEGVGWFLVNNACGPPSGSPVGGCCCTEPAVGYGGCSKVADIGKTATSQCASGTGSCPPFSACSTTTTTPIPCGGVCYMGCIGGVWVVETNCNPICPCNGVHYIQGPVSAGDPCYEPTGPSSVGGTCGTSTTTTPPPTTTTGTTSPPACGGNCTWVWNAGGAMWTKTVSCAAPFPCTCFQPFMGGAFNGEVKYTACS